VVVAVHIVCMPNKFCRNCPHHTTG